MRPSASGRRSGKRVSPAEACRPFRASCWRGHLSRRSTFLPRTPRKLNHRHKRSGSRSLVPPCSTTVWEQGKTRKKRAETCGGARQQCGMRVSILYPIRSSTAKTKKINKTQREDIKRLPARFNDTINLQVLLRRERRVKSTQDTVFYTWRCGELPFPLNQICQRINKKSTKKSASIDRRVLFYAKYKKQTPCLPRSVIEGDDELLRPLDADSLPPVGVIGVGVLGFQRQRLCCRHHPSEACQCQPDDGGDVMGQIETKGFEQNATRYVLQ